MYINKIQLFLFNPRFVLFMINPVIDIFLRIEIMSVDKEKKLMFCSFQCRPNSFWREANRNGTEADDWRFNHERY